MRCRKVAVAKSASIILWVRKVYKTLLLVLYKQCIKGLVHPKMKIHL